MKKIEGLEKEVSTLWQDLQSRHPERLSLMRSLPVSASDIQRILPANTALVEYYISRGQVGAFLLTREKIRAFPFLAPLVDVLNILEELAFQFSKFQFGPDYYKRNKTSLIKSTEAVLERAGQLLIEPFLGDLGSLESLIIVPHGPLHTLPFQALRLKGRYLIEQFSLSYSPSAAVLKYCQEKPARPEGRRPYALKALLAGVPDERATCVTGEIEGLKKLFGEAQVLLGDQATLENFRQAASESGLIHLAAHGIFRPEAPLLSSIHLSDGWLAVQDIYNLDLQAALVTLSACETGLGRDLGGDDLVGLVRGFLYAGARSLLVSLWMVEDESMARLMRTFYSFWLAGDSQAKALQKAQLDLLKTYEHPFYWAPLNLVGAES